jgi:hypothetical protein
MFTFAQQECVVVLSGGTSEVLMMKHGLSPTGHYFVPTKEWL